MRKVILILIALELLVFGQHKKKTIEDYRKELLDNIEIKVEEVEPNIFKITDGFGFVTYKNLSNYDESKLDNLKLEYSPQADTLIIDLTQIDTMLYYNKYKFWRKVPVALLAKGPFVDDVNNNDRAEIYGLHYKIISIYEDKGNFQFDSVYTYPKEYLHILGIYDIDNDGDKEILLSKDHRYFGSYTGFYTFFKKPSSRSLPIIKNALTIPLNFDLGRHLHFGNFDGDYLVDLMGTVSDSFDHIRIMEFNPVINNFDTRFIFDYHPIGYYFQGYAIGDFDKDGLIEFLGGNIHGKVLCIENNGNDNYQFTWQGQVETYNAYLYASTNDLDGNGKDEIWIGGQAFYYDYPKTRITIFEASGDNNYRVVGRIDINGLFSLTGAFQLFSEDLDSDGKKEIILCSGGLLFVFKFAGSINHQQYELFYFRPNENRTPSGSIKGYLAAMTYDFDKDGYPEIITGNLGDTDVPGQGYYSFIYQHNFSSKIDMQNETSYKFYLYPNYPNPFNSDTNIKFTIDNNTYASLKIYNSLGEEVKGLLEKEITKGEYNFHWDGSDNGGKSLPSGIYLIVLKTNEKQLIQKSIILK